MWRPECPGSPFATPAAPATACWPISTCIPGVAMQILRHARLSVTMEIYTVISSAKIRDALKRLGASLG